MSIWGYLFSNSYFLFPKMNFQQSKSPLGITKAWSSLRGGARVSIFLIHFGNALK